MSAHVVNITFDCDDAFRLGSFWAEVLGRSLDPGSSSGFASIGGADPARTEPAWYFEKVPELKTAKNRMHVDLVDPDTASVERLVSLGATIVGEQEFDGGRHRWTVMQDPEGNEFCVAEKSFTG